MNSARTINKVLNNQPTMEGAGVRLNRVFGFHQIQDFDPFLLLDDFGSDDSSAIGVQRDLSVVRKDRVITRQGWQFADRNEHIALLVKE